MRYFWPQWSLFLNMISLTDIVDLELLAYWSQDWNRSVATDPGSAILISTTPWSRMLWNTPTSPHHTTRVLFIEEIKMGLFRMIASETRPELVHNSHNDNLLYGSIGGIVLQRMAFSSLSGPPIRAMTMENIAPNSMSHKICKLFPNVLNCGAY